MKHDCYMTINFNGHLQNDCKNIYNNQKKDAYVHLYRNYYLFAII